MSPHNHDPSSQRNQGSGHPFQDHVEPEDRGTETGHANESADNRGLPVQPPYQITFQRIDSHCDGEPEVQAPPLEPAPVDHSQTQQGCELLTRRPAIAPASQDPASQKPNALGNTSPKSRAGSKPVRRIPDPITQTLGLLASMVMMLLVARFVVPTIVEEVRYAWHRGELRAEYEMGTDGLKNVSLEALSDAYGMVTAVVGPSVVHIDVKRRQSLRQIIGDGNVTQKKIGPRRLPSLSDQGSGIVVGSDGYILTNSHVISGGEDITVTLSDGRHTPAIIIGVDPLTDLAVLKVNANDLIPITWGDSDAIKVGEPVWAVGSPFGLDRTVTFGIISGKHRTVRASTQWQDFMQSDVAVNPGNSGGPLVNARGSLIGVNTAIVGDTYQGVSFSVPSNTAKKIYERLVESGKVQRGWLGVSLASVSDHELVGGNLRVRGAIIDYLPDSNAPAAIAGVQAGDLVTHVDGTPVRDMQHLMQLIGEAVPQQTIRLEIHRLGEPLQIGVTLGARPEMAGR